MIPHEYIEEVVRRNEIVDVVGGYLQLHRKGRQHSGLCPFHNEKTPSFYLYPETQSFYCFGCGKGGDVITFTKEIQNIDYLEAVKMLAERAGMPAPNEDDKVGKMRSRVLSINRDAARFYFMCLNSSTDEAQVARAYWRRRGLDDATIKRFGLGYSPDSFRTTHEYLRERGYTTEEMLESGLVKRSEKGNLYDVFRGRVMTPIFDLRGNVIAFGGRVLDDSKPKYINSPETLVYKKSKTMYALNYAKKSASKRYVLCEGYMDVISMQRAGVETAVCACGTALTTEQVKLLDEYAEEVVLCYDSDEAGQKATVRSLELFKNTNLRIKVLKVPDVKDPDEYIKKYGASRFHALLDGTDNEVEFKLGMVRKEFDLENDQDRVEYLKQGVRVIAARSSPTEREVYAGRLAEETGVSKTAVLTQLETEHKRYQRQRRGQAQKALASEGLAQQINVPYQSGGPKALGVASAEQQLMVALVREPAELAFVREKLAPEKLILPDTQAIYRLMLQYQDQGTAISVASLNTNLDEKARSGLTHLIALHSDAPQTRQDIEFYLERIEMGLPKSKDAANMTVAELVEYMESMRSKKA